MLRFVFLLILLISCTFLRAQNEADSITWPYDGDFLSADFHAERRDSLRSKMPKESVAVFLAYPQHTRSKDIKYEYHPAPNIYYLSGYREPNALLLVFKEKIKWKGKKTNEVIFVQPRDESSEIWDGKRRGVKGVKEILKIETVIENYRFPDISTFFESVNTIYCTAERRDIQDNLEEKGDLYSMTESLNNKLEKFDGTTDRDHLTQWMAQLRQVKTKKEIRLLKKAINITCTAQKALMKKLTPELTEYQAEAIIEYNFKYNGAEEPGFPSIVGGGENSCILHYNSNRKPLQKNEMLVTDVGAEYHGYSADVTRTMPTDGRFSDVEKAIYEIVYTAQQKGVEACKPGNKFWAPHKAAKEIITQGLLRLGIIKNKSEVSKYFMHGTSHYLGLDVHDVGLYNPLAPGNVITVEPGVYIAKGSDCDPKWWNIGIRIEDDVLITEEGHDNLSDCVPKSWQEIEELMSE